MFKNETARQKIKKSKLFARGLEIKQI